eukprot:SAG11_NODE_2397_length_3404_cov_1.824508_1_plen_281_part_00
MDMDALHKDKSILVTGVTGFVGKVVLEKLIHELPELGSIFVMVRGSEGKGRDRRKHSGAEALDERIRTADARFTKDVLSSPIWNARVRQAGESDEEFCARVRKRVTVVAGSLGGERCSIPQAQWARLCVEVDTIIHCAASVSFDDPLQKQIDTNVVGAAELIKILCGRPRPSNTRTFVHVSTCYVGFPLGATVEEAAVSDGFVEEGECDFPYDPDSLLALMRSSTTEEVAQLQPALLRGENLKSVKSRSDKCKENGRGFEASAQALQSIQSIDCSSLEMS